MKQKLRQDSTLREVKHLRKALIFTMVVAMLLAMTSLALARQENNDGTPYSGTGAGGSGKENPAHPKGNIAANEYTWGQDNIPLQDWNYYEQGSAVKSGTYEKADGKASSTHLYGTWNSPYSLGVDGFNYNDSQDYVAGGNQANKDGTAVLPGDTVYDDNIFTSGPHGGYLTSTHRCRECHAVHRAAGKFKLLRSDTRFEACDWCHGTGAGSGFNIQMDNDDLYTTEFNVGHTMGYGIDSGKWKAPDDTYPAFTPNYYMGGFSCFDCHSPHANPARLLGYNSAGTPVGIQESGKVFGIANPGHADLTADDTTHASGKPVYLSGSWILIKNPDAEISLKGGTNIPSGITGEPSGSWSINAEIPDTVTAGLNEFDTSTPFPVNKIAIDWNVPIGAVMPENSTTGYSVRNTAADSNYWSLTEFCTDCHDGNAGLHTVQAPLFSEDRALRNDAVAAKQADYWKGNYDLAYGHDEQSRHGCERQLKFDPEDNADFGPNCRNCHKGASACGTCHADTKTAFTSVASEAATNGLSQSTYNVVATSTNYNQATGAFVQNNFGSGFLKTSRTVDWTDVTGTATNYNWRTAEETASASCSDDGFSWPHRTLGWKMLKDDLFGLDFDGTPVAVGEARVAVSSVTPAMGADNATKLGVLSGQVAHDIDSVCLDCHNPTIWNATSAATHDDAKGIYNDELILRGLP